MSKISIRFGISDNRIRYMRNEGRPDTIPSIHNQGDHTLPYGLMMHSLEWMFQDKNLDEAYRDLRLYIFNQKSYLNNRRGLYTPHHREYPSKSRNAYGMKPSNFQITQRIETKTREIQSDEDRRIVKIKTPTEYWYKNYVYFTEIKYVEDYFKQFLNSNFSSLNDTGKLTFLSEATELLVEIQQYYPTTAYNRLKKIRLTESFADLLGLIRSPPIKAGQLMRYNNVSSPLSEQEKHKEQQIAEKLAELTDFNIENQATLFGANKKLEKNLMEQDKRNIDEELIQILHRALFFITPMYSINNYDGFAKHFLYNLFYKKDIEDVSEFINYFDDKFQIVETTDVDYVLGNVKSALFYTKENLESTDQNRVAIYQNRDAELKPPNPKRQKLNSGDWKRT